MNPSSNPSSGSEVALEIEPGQLQALRDTQGPLLLLDVREPWEYAAARIPGSTLIPMGEVPARAYNELDPEARIITICHHGVRSLHVAAWLRQQGYDQAQSLRGGIDAWSAIIDDSIPRY